MLVGGVPVGAIAYQYSKLINVPTDGTVVVTLNDGIAVVVIGSLITGGLGVPRIVGSDNPELSAGI